MGKYSVPEEIRAMKPRGTLIYLGLLRSQKKLIEI